MCLNDLTRHFREINCISFLFSIFLKRGRKEKKLVTFQLEVTFCLAQHTSMSHGIKNCLQSCWCSYIMSYIRAVGSSGTICPPPPLLKYWNRVNVLAEIALLTHGSYGYVDSCSKLIRQKCYQFFIKEKMKKKIPVFYPIMCLIKSPKNFEK